jgi:hypothetical protein
MYHKFALAVMVLVVAPAAWAAAGLPVAETPATPKSVGLGRGVADDAPVAIWQPSPAGMSGDFADRRLADAGTTLPAVGGIRRPHVHHPETRWFTQSGPGSTTGHRACADRVTARTARVA